MEGYVENGRDGNVGNGPKSGRESGRERLSKNFRDGNPGRERAQKSSGRDGTGREVPVPPPALPYSTCTQMRKERSQHIEVMGRRKLR
jgi:hypothetical protein